MTLFFLQKLQKHTKEQKIITQGINWKSIVPSKVLVFSWRLLQNRLPTQTQLHRRGIITTLLDQACVLCGKEIEEYNHLFLYALLLMGFGLCSLGVAWAQFCYANKHLKTIYSARRVLLGEEIEAYKISFLACDLLVYLVHEEQHYFQERKTKTHGGGGPNQGYVRAMDPIKKGGSTGNVLLLLVH